MQKFSPDGAHLATFAGSDSGVGTLHRPTGVAVDSEGDVYITDWHDHQLRVFASDGRYIASLVGDAQQLSPWAQEYIELNQDTLKARRRVNLEPEWTFHQDCPSVNWREDLPVSCCATTVEEGTSTRGPWN